MEIDLTKLNPPQREAVTCTEGPLLVLAGAGSGKTRVLTTRIAYLIAEKGVAPYHILALTFTNKAAKEMKERVQKLTGDEASVWLFTFHGFCARLLSMEIDALGYDRRFSIYDEDDQQALIGHIIKDLNLNGKVFRSACWRASSPTPRTIPCGPRTIWSRAISPGRSRKPSLSIRSG